MSRSIRVGLGFDADVLLLQRYKERLSELDIVLFPELMDGGYAALKRGMKAHTINDGFVSILKNASEEFSNTIIAGSIFLKEGTSRPTNTSLVFSRGKLIHRYDKMHLFKPTGDPKYFARGLRTGIFKPRAHKKSVSAGVVICYDLRFPELMRMMALEGMKILFVPARWPMARDDAWQTLLKARAIENQIFVVGCNSSDAEGGYSYAFDPFGAMIFSNRKTTRSLLETVVMDLNRLEEARSLHHNLKEAIFLRQRLKL